MKLRTTASLMLVAALACSGGRRAKFKIHEMRVDDSCTKILDYCVRGRCVVENLGEVAGTAKVKFTLTTSGSSSTVTGVGTKLIAAGALEEVTYDFPEAKLTQSSHVQCALR